MSKQAHLCCESCGYELMGLGMRGKCPECGQYFDVLSGAGVLTGSRAERDRRADRLAVRLRTILLGLGTLGVLVCGGLLSLIAQTPATPITLAIVFAAVGLLATVTSYVCGKDDEG